MDLTPETVVKPKLFAGAGELLQPSCILLFETQPGVGFPPSSLWLPLLAATHSPIDLSLAGARRHTALLADDEEMFASPVLAAEGGLIDWAAAPGLLDVLSSPSCDCPSLSDLLDSSEEEDLLL
jgi:hypothetical protein